MVTLIQNLILLTFGFNTVWADEAIKIHTTTGILHGKRTILLEKPLVNFLGVPYARPPVGDLRFKPPLEMISDTTPRDASRFASSCYQPLHLKSVISPLLKPNQAELSEDCLYLNVYVPEEGFGSNHLLPVMIWLPGEGFDYADPQQFDGSYLAVLGKVIVVTVSYRVSVFGFLSTSTDEAPGNVGLLDQRMAMKWVQKNIARFGGDPENVTLFGRFTGSMSVGIHAFSPLSLEEKLFGRVIMQSGVAVGKWVFENNPFNATLQLAEITNCLSSSVANLISCLRRLPADILLQTALTVPQRWRPVYDNRLIYEDTLSAAGKMNYNHADVLMGVNSDEGSICTIALNAMHSPLYHKILRRELTTVDFQELVNNNLQEIYKLQDVLITELSIHEYGVNEGKKTSLRDTFVDFCGDLYITSNVQKLADVLSAHNLERSVYMYEFTHRPSFSIHPSFIKAGHGDDVLFALGLPFQLPDIPHEEMKLTKRMVETFSNFARRGNPNRKNSTEGWPVYSAEGHELMKFGITKVAGAVSRSSHDTAVRFWHEIIPTALTHSCTPSEPGFKPFSSTRRPEAAPDNGPETLLFGNSLTPVSSKYLVFGLIFSTVFLFVAFSVAIIALHRSNRYGDFNRLR